MKVSCIVPAYNEVKNIHRPLAVLTKSDLIDEIIVVDNASTDGTPEAVEKTFPEVKVIRHSKNLGKADSMVTGAKAAKNSILFFCDADLTDLKKKHIKQMLMPVFDGKAKLVAGMQEFMNTLRKKEVKDASEFIKTIGGEKALFKKDFLSIPGLVGSGYAVEKKIVDYYKKQNWPIEFIILKGVGHVHKIKKWGLIDGLIKEIKALATLGRQFLQG